MKLQIKAGSTSQSVMVFIQNNSVTTGAGLTGLVFNTASLVAYYTFPGAATTATAITLATLATVTTAWASGGFKEIDATNMPGLYRLDLPNAVLAGGSGRSVVVMLQGATNMVPTLLEIELTAVDNQDAIRFGMTALPNAAAEAAGGLYTRGTGAGQINQANNGQIDVNAVRMSGTVLTARDIGASVLLSTGTGTGQLDFTLGVVKANATQLAGQTVTAGAGVTFPSSIASPTNITAGTITNVTNLTNAPTAGDLTATMKASVTTAATAATPTAAAVTAPVSVTGDFSATMKTSITTAATAATPTAAAVTGNVGGNVVGSVGNVGTGGITASSFGANAIDATALAASAVSEIQTGLATDANLAIVNNNVIAVPGAVWDVTLSGHLTAGSTGAALNAAGSAGDPWNTALPGGYGAGSAGYIVGHNIDALITSRLASADYVAPDNATITAINLKTANLPAAPAAVSDIPTAAANALALLKFDMSTVTGEALRSPINALRFLRNKWSVLTGVLTVTKENDTTTAWQANVDTDAAALPVIGSDPTA